MARKQHAFTPQAGEGLKSPLGAVVGMVGQQRAGAVELFGQDQAHQHVRQGQRPQRPLLVGTRDDVGGMPFRAADKERSEEHTSELQSLMRISYAVFRLKKKKNNKQKRLTHYTKHQDKY